MKGLEPPRLSAQDPKSCAATNYATPALKNVAQRYHFLLSMKIIDCIFLFAAPRYGIASLNLYQLIFPCTQTYFLGMVKSSLPMSIGMCQLKFVLSLVMIMRIIIGNPAVR